MVWLDSKTTVPHAVPEAVERQRLFDILHYNGSKKLTIVRAPAGYGKTTLLCQWISQFDEPVVWLSIDAMDNDPIRFWKYVIRTVSDAVTNDIESQLCSLFNGQSPTESLIDSFLNEIDAIPGTIHIVIDDYHLIENPVIHQMMARFIEYLPSHIHLYLSSRMELPLPLAKWRVKGWLTEIGMDQLRFTYEEVERLYNKRRFVHDNTESLQQIVNMTEGWAAGIQLARLSGNAFPSSEWQPHLIDSAQPFITEFLLQEILASLPPDIQEFLMYTSIVNQLEPAICDALTQRADSYQVLLELEKKGLFIVRLHANKPIFRYHHLFANALQIELQNRHSQASISSIYKEVATLLREQGDYMSAIELALQGRLYDLADSWMTIHLVEIFTLGQTSIFMRWVRTLRENDYVVNVEILVMYVITLSTLYEVEEAIQLIVELHDRHEVDHWMDDADYQGMATILDTVSAFVLLVGSHDIEQSMRIISKQVDRGRVSSRWDHIPMQYNWVEPTLLRTSFGARGRLLRQEEVLPLMALFQEADMKKKNITGFALGVTAETSYYRHSIDQAMIELEVALRFGHHFKDPGLYIPMYILKGRVYAAKKQFVEAHAVLDYAMETVQERHWLDSLRVMKAECYLLEGEIPQAERELAGSTGLNHLDAKSEQEFWLLVHARLLLAKGKIMDALTTSIRVKEKAQQERQILTTLEATVLEAICQIELGNQAAALSSLHKALEQGAPYGYVRTFLDATAVIPLLKKYLTVRQTGSHAHWNSVPITYIEQLLVGEQHETDQNSVMDMLTPREQDVLQLLTGGASNSEIAKKLALSAGTVRVYLSTIYSKLGVTSRTQAVLLAKEEER